MVNQSKANDMRFWNNWRESGAVESLYASDERKAERLARQNKMSEFNYEQELKKAREAAAGLQGELEAKILGKTRTAWRCGCGELSCGQAKAVVIEPAGQQYEYQITIWSLWSVGMQETSERAKRYWCGLDDFLPESQINEMFGKYFAGIDAEAIKTEYFKRKSERERQNGQLSNFGGK